MIRKGNTSATVPSLVTVASVIVWLFWTKDVGYAKVLGAGAVMSRVMEVAKDLKAALPLWLTSRLPY